ncbi:MAG: sodium:solute symporter, partial [Bacteroidia bacterium]
LFAFGLFNKISVKDRLVPIVCIAAPVLSYILNANSKALLGGYSFGFELLIINGLLTFAGLWLIKSNNRYD